MDNKLVKVTWLDASDPPGESHGWYSDKDIEDFTGVKVEVVSVGFVKSETKLYLTLVADYIENPDGTMTWGRPTKIPIGWLTKVEELKGVENAE